VLRVVTEVFVIVLSLLRVLTVLLSNKFVKLFGVLEVWRETDFRQKPRKRLTRFLGAGTQGFESDGVRERTGFDDGPRSGVGLSASRAGYSSPSCLA
jgi:hypothetical protein